MEIYGNLCDEWLCYRGRHLWNEARTPELNSADIGEETIRSYKLPFWLANLFADKGDIFKLGWLIGFVKRAVTEVKVGVEGGTTLGFLEKANMGPVIEVSPF
jgi:hypothetical protein